MAKSRLEARVSGLVQGVGFRWWVRSQAQDLGLAGWARNNNDGSVSIVVEGDEADVESLVQRLTEQPTTTRRPGSVDEVEQKRTSPQGEDGFSTY